MSALLALLLPLGCRPDDAPTAFDEATGASTVTRSDAAWTLRPAGDAAPLSFALDLDAVGPANVEIDWAASDDDHVGHAAFAVDGPTDALPLLGFRPDRHYDVVVSVDGAPGPVQAVHVPALDLAALHIEVVTSAPPGDPDRLTLLPLWGGGFQAEQAVVLDAEGEVVYLLRQESCTFEARTAGDHLVTLVGRGAVAIRELSWLGAPLRSFYSAAEPPDVDLVDAIAVDLPGRLHHDMVPLDDGGYVVLSKNVRQIDGYPLSYDDPTVRGTARIDADVVARFDADGALLWGYDLSKLLDPRRIGFDSLSRAVGTNAYEWGHANAVWVEPDGRVGVSLRHQDEIVLLDPDAGRIDWVLGNRANRRRSAHAPLLEPTAGTELPYHAHAARRIDGLLTVFDNGNWRASPGEVPSDEAPDPTALHSRLAAFEIDEVRGTVRQRYALDLGESVGPVYANGLGDHDILPDGHVLGTFGRIIARDGQLTTAWEAAAGGEPHRRVRRARPRGLAPAPDHRPRGPTRRVRQLARRARHLPGSGPMIALLALACGGDPAAVTLPAAPVAVGAPGRVALHRLNRAEYDATVHDLLGTDQTPARAFPPDDTTAGFDNQADTLSVSPLHVELYELAAQQLADELVRPGLPGPRRGNPVRERWVRCDPAERGDLPCVEDTLDRFLPHAWRRPVTRPERERILGLAREVSARGGTFEEALRTAVVAALLHPSFLYRVELPRAATGEAAPVSGYELASRLSYFLWSSMPDDALFDAARDDTLQTPAQIAAQVDRMLADPRSLALTENFAGQWLYLRAIDALYKDPARFPELDDPLRAAMAEEAARFFDAFVDDDRDLHEILTATRWEVDPRLAAHYGLPPVDGWREVDLAGTGRHGLLGQAGWLAVAAYPTRTSPVIRGEFVLSQLLCSAPPPPPPNITPLAETDDAGSVREQLEAHRANPQCAACHATMDDIGFALENFDALGAWRDADHGVPVDTTGEVLGQPVDGPDDLSAVLAGDARFERCLVEQAFTYALGRQPTPLDAPALDAIQAASADGGWTFRALATAIATSAPFTTREVAP
ncbi:MAG: DUF1592 domain-containing protein [Myxococcota bacterium]